MKPNYTHPLNGDCPIQAEGVTSCGLPWYFRARSNVSLRVGRTPGCDPIREALWAVNDDEPDALPFGTLDYPGWASHEACEAWIEKALDRFEEWKAGQKKN